jgi:hypothetical protein
MISFRKDLAGIQARWQKGLELGPKYRAAKLI